MVFCRFAVGDVGYNADQTVSFPIRHTSNNSSVASEPESCAVRPNHPVFRRKRILVVCKLVEFFSSNGGHRGVALPNIRLGRLPHARGHPGG